MALVNGLLCMAEQPNAKSDNFIKAKDGLCREANLKLISVTVLKS